MYLYNISNGNIGSHTLWQYHHILAMLVDFRKLYTHQEPYPLFWFDTPIMTRFSYDVMVENCYVTKINQKKFLVILSSNRWVSINS